MRTHFRPEDGTQQFTAAVGHEVVFGECGVAQLPMGACVEIELIAEVE